MRALPVTFLVLLMLPLPVGAQDGGGNHLLEDAAGDHAVQVEGTPLPAAPWGSLDLLALDWSEAADAFTLVLHTGSLEGDRPATLMVDSVSWLVHMESGGVQYAVEVANNPFLESFYRARLLQLDPASERYAVVSVLDLLVDAVQDTFTVTVPRDLLADADGKAPDLGDSLDGIHATSQAFVVDVGGDLLPGPSVSAGDRMPDDGAAAWTVRYGTPQSGHVRLDSDRPVRTSNGEATTFLYEVEATNLGDAPDRVRLEAVEAPDDWSVSFPDGEVRLQGGETRTVPVLVTVPFVHQHGSFRSLLVEAHSQSDPDGVGRIELGVRYTAVPQPAGHHDTLYFHSAPSGLYLNTLEDHPADTGEPVAVRGEGGSIVTNTYRWTVPLLPALEMGLDLDGARRGAVEFLLEMPAGGLQATSRGTLYVGSQPDLFDPSDGDNTALGVFEADVGDVHPGDSVPVTGEFEILPGADRHPHEPEANLFLQIEVTAVSVFGTSLTPASPRIHPGGLLQLPLEEWHDDVDEYFRHADGVDLYASGLRERLVNPGRTAVFQVTAENLDSEARHVRLSLNGLNAEWARVLGDLDLHLDPGQQRTLAVAVTPPETAVDGERVDMTLHVSQADDPSVRSLVRLVAEVDTEADHPDEAESAVELDAALAGRESPVPALAPLALVGVALLRRRRA